MSSESKKKSSLTKAGITALLASSGCLFNQDAMEENEVILSLPTCDATCSATSLFNIGDSTTEFEVVAVSLKATASAGEGSTSEDIDLSLSIATTGIEAGAANLYLYSDCGIDWVQTTPDVAEDCAACAQTLNFKATGIFNAGVYDDCVVAAQEDEQPIGLSIPISLVLDAQNPNGLEPPDVDYKYCLKVGVDVEMEASIVVGLEAEEEVAQEASASVGIAAEAHLVPIFKSGESADNFQNTPLANTFAQAVQSYPISDAFCFKVSPSGVDKAEYYMRIYNAHLTCTEQDGAERQLGIMDQGEVYTSPGDYNPALVSCAEGLVSAGVLGTTSFTADMVEFEHHCCLYAYDNWLGEYVDIEKDVPAPCVINIEVQTYKYEYDYGTTSSLLELDSESADLRKKEAAVEQEEDGPETNYDLRRLSLQLPVRRNLQESQTTPPVDVNLELQSFSAQFSSVTGNSECRASTGATDSTVLATVQRFIASIIAVDVSDVTVNDKTGDVVASGLSTELANYCVAKLQEEVADGGGLRLALFAGANDAELRASVLSYLADEGVLFASEGDDEDDDKKNTVEISTTTVAILAGVGAVLLLGLLTVGGALLYFFIARGAGAEAEKCAVIAPTATNVKPLSTDASNDVNVVYSEEQA